MTTELTFQHNHKNITVYLYITKLTCALDRQRFSKDTAQKHHNMVSSVVLLFLIRKMTVPNTFSVAVRLPAN